MPDLRQAGMSSIPAVAVSFFPSTVKVTSGILSLCRDGLADWAIGRNLNRQLRDEGGFGVLKVFAIEPGRGSVGVRDRVTLLCHPFRVSLAGRRHRCERLANSHTAGSLRRMEREIRAGRISVEHTMSPVHFCPACSRI